MFPGALLERHSDLSMVLYLVTRRRYRGGESLGGRRETTYTSSRPCPRTSLLKGRRSFILALGLLHRIGLETTSTMEA